MLFNCGTKIGEIKGQHESPKSKNDVSALSITNSVFNEFDVNYFRDFMNLKNLAIYDTKLGKSVNICNDNLENLVVTKTTFSGYSAKIKNCLNLTRLIMENSNLKSVEIDDCKSLTDLSLKENEIQEIAENFFAKMKELRNIQFSRNKLENLDGKLFSNNLKLEVINFSENNIKFIGSEFLSANKNLFVINFQNAGCLNGNYKKNNIAVFKREVEKCNKKHSG